MSYAKDLLARAEQQRDMAIEIALRARVLRSCGFHGEVFSSEEPIESAYRLGNARFSKGSLRASFASRIELTDAIKNAVEDHPADMCPRCAKFALE